MAFQYLRSNKSYSMKRKAERSTSEKPRDGKCSEAELKRQLRKGRTLLRRYRDTLKALSKSR